MHLEFFDQVQNLHAFDSFISFILLLQEVPDFIFIFSVMILLKIVDETVANKLAFAFDFHYLISL